MHAQEVKRYAPRLLEHQKYPRCEEQLCGRRLPLGSHAPALCLFQLRSGNMGEARSWVVCPTWSHTLRFCALHLIAVALSWGAHSSHSRCRFAAIISSSARRGVKLELLSGAKCLHRSDMSHRRVPPVQPFRPVGEPANRML